MVRVPVDLPPEVAKKLQEAVRRVLLSRFCGTFPAESPIYTPRNIDCLLSRFHGSNREMRD
eukprot:SAG31_NODE_2590_length_5426_cov_4.118265_2_plen_61_part_00